MPELSHIPILLRKFDHESVLDSGVPTTIQATHIQSASGLIVVHLGTLDGPVDLATDLQNTAVLLRTVTLEVCCV